MGVKTRASSPGGSYIFFGTIATRPLAGVANRYYWATDEQILYRDTGAVWQAENPHYDRCIWTMYAGSANLGPGANTISLSPLIIRTRCTINAIGAPVATVAAAPDDEAVFGLYRSSADLPDGQDLVVQSISTVLTTNLRNELAVAPTQLDPGLYYLAIHLKGATILRGHSGAPEVGGTPQGRRVTVVYGALPAVCPATVASNIFVYAYVLVSSVP